MFFAAELLLYLLLLLLVALVFLFGLLKVFSSFDLVLSGLLRDYAGLGFFLLAKRLLAGIFFAEFLVFFAVSSMLCHTLSLNKLRRFCSFVDNLCDPSICWKVFVGIVLLFYNC